MSPENSEKKLLKFEELKNIDFLSNLEIKFIPPNPFQIDLNQEACMISHAHTHLQMHAHRQMCDRLSRQIKAVFRDD